MYYPRECSQKCILSLGSVAGSLYLQQGSMYYPRECSGKCLLSLGNLSRNMNYPQGVYREICTIQGVQQEVNIPREGSGEYVLSQGVQPKVYTILRECSSLLLAGSLYYPQGVYQEISNIPRECIGKYVLSQGMQLKVNSIRREYCKEVCTIPRGRTQG